MTFSRWGRSLLPSLRDELHRSSSLRPWSGAGAGLQSARDPMTNALKFFANEMRAMEREMNRMEHDFFGSANRNNFFSSLFDKNNATAGGEQQQQQSSSGDISDYIVEDKDGKKKLQLEFDAQGFKPENIHVSTRGKNRIEINAKYQDESDGHRVYQEFTKLMTVPDGTDIKQLSCHFDNNSLVIEAPYTAPKQPDNQKAIDGASKSGPHKISVQHLGDDDFSAQSGNHFYDDSNPMVGGNAQQQQQEQWPPQSRTADKKADNFTSTSSSADKNNNNKYEDQQKSNKQAARSY